MNRRFPSILFASLFLLLLCGCASSKPRKVDLRKRPQLKTVGGIAEFKWKETHSVDSGVCLGTLIRDKKSGAGIYAGGNPDFHVSPGVEPVKARLGTFDVEWYPSDDSGNRYYRTCLIRYQTTTQTFANRTHTRTEYCRVWAYSNTAAGLDKVISALGRLAMFQLANNPPAATGDTQDRAP